MFNIFHNYDIELKNYKPVSDEHCPLLGVKNEGMLAQPHLLIAGATGSGKSVLINDLLSELLLVGTPSDTQIILIDPKKVELYKYRISPLCFKYASENEDISKLLNWAIDEMMARYKQMQQANLVKYNGKHIYIFIDELADLLTTNKKQVLPQLQRIAQLGRAAKIHLIMATQRPTKDILSGQLKVNLDSRVALRCPTPQDSRNIIDMTGAELLPRYGQAIYKSPENLTPVLIDIPYIESQAIQNLINMTCNKMSCSYIKWHSKEVMNCNI